MEEGIQAVDGPLNRSGAAAEGSVAFASPLPAPRPSPSPSLSPFPSDLALQNWTYFACVTLAECLRAQGLEQAYVSPGLRDAPMIGALLAVGIEAISCPDERAGAFEALGYSRAKAKPCLLLCTSGTAAANYYPAVIEAFEDGLPLFIITADRPFDLVFAKAQQVIDQRQIFGRFVKASYDFVQPGPSWPVPAVASYVQQLWELCLRAPSGPVHINLPLPTPLEPKESVGARAELIAARQRAKAHLAARDFKSIEAHMIAEMGPLLQMLKGWADAKANGEKALLLLGRLSAEQRPYALRLAAWLGWPVYADVASGLRGELLALQKAEGGPLVLEDPCTPRLRQALIEYGPSRCLHIGKRLLSGAFEGLLGELGLRDYEILSDEAVGQDALHLACRRQHRMSLSAGLPGVLKALTQMTPPASLIQPTTLALAEAQNTQSQLRSSWSAGFCFADVAQTVLDLTDSEDGLFIGNSTAIRAFDSWSSWPLGKSWPQLFVQRGVSGIEGHVATGLGIQKAIGRPVTVVLGDMAGWHDLNSFLSLARAEHAVRVVLVNNAGGRIFEQLPIGQYPWLTNPLVTTPHGFSFEGIAQMAALPYTLCKDAKSFRESYSGALAQGASCLIECSQAQLVDRTYSLHLKGA